MCGNDTGEVGVTRELIICDVPGLGSNAVGAVGWEEVGGAPMVHRREGIVRHILRNRPFSRPPKLFLGIFPS